MHRHRRLTPRERAQILEEQQRNLGPRVERRDLRALPRGRRRDRRRVRLEAREHVESRLTRSRRGGGAHALVLRPKHPHARGHRGGRRRLVLNGLDERECALHALEPGNVPARVGLGRFRDGPGERPRLLGGQGAIGEKLLREAHGGRGDVRVSRRTRQLDGSEDVLRGRGAKSRACEREAGSWHLERLDLSVGLSVARGGSPPRPLS